MKRIFDIILSAILMVPAIPVVGLLMLATKLTSPGPALFRQTRIGRHQIPFVCLKMRTMHVDTPDLPSHEVSANSITPMGRYLRKSKLDELPQLWNILVGEMSFVGPRPCLPSQVALISARQRRNLYALRPGITGIAQVAGVDMSDAEKLASLDAEYLQDMSIPADLRLILATAFGAGRGDRTTS